MKSYEEFLQEILDKVPSNVDKREGSIIYDAIAPLAFFILEQEFKLENFKDLVFVDTAVGEFLDRLAFQYGLKRKGATKAKRLGRSEKLDIELGTRWVKENIIYTVIKNNGDGNYELECESFGVLGNQYKGETTSFDTSGTINLENILLAGTEIESDEELRKRIIEKLKNPSTSGNANHYRQWALEVEGVGKVKVFPLDDGAGTVTVMVINSNMEIDSGILEKVKVHIDKLKPIGATLKVISPTKLPIRISASVRIRKDTNLDKVKELTQNSLDKYLKSMIFETDYISYAKLSSLLLDIDGIEDFSDFRLNADIENVNVGAKQVAVLTSLDLVSA